MAATADPKVSRLFDKLLHAAEEQDNDQALAVADEILQLLPNDEDALKCKIVAMIRLERYADALSLLKSSSNQHSLIFEKIYCYYQTNEFQIALDLIAAAKKHDNVELQSVKAQILYSQEEHREAIGVYESLLEKTPKDDKLHGELQVNLLAAKTCLAFEQPSLASDDAVDNQLANAQSEASSYEMAYNAGSVYLARGDLDKACTVLEKARDQCNGSDEVDQATIESQLAYTYQMQGSDADALHIYEDIVSSSLQHAAIATAVQTNLLALRQSEDAVQKILQRSKDADGGLKRFQRRVLEVNEAQLRSWQTEADPSALSGEVMKMRGLERVAMKAAPTVKAASKRRKPQLPRSYDANKEPDPERWLPKHERSTYKPKGKKKAITRGSQGATAVAGGSGGASPVIESQSSTRATVDTAAARMLKKKKKKGKK